MTSCRWMFSADLDDSDDDGDAVPKDLPDKHCHSSRRESRDGTADRTSMSTSLIGCRTSHRC